MRSSLACLLTAPGVGIVPWLCTERTPHEEQALCSGAWGQYLMFMSPCLGFFDLCYVRGCRGVQDQLEGDLLTSRQPVRSHCNLLHVHVAPCSLQVPDHSHD